MADSTTPGPSRADSSVPAQGAPEPAPAPAFSQPQMHDPLQSALWDFAKRHSVTWPAAVAYSGGADSSALLHAASQCWPGQIRAIHVHHGLQAAADDFERHSREVCKALSVPLEVRRVQAQPQSGQSPEDAARRHRYAALADAARQQGCRWVMLAQHADDQAETVLLALGRGAGLPGLSAMPEWFEREGMSFARPVLQWPGAGLRQWLCERGLGFVDDPTNSDDRYSRNRLRARLMPVLAEVMPHYRQTLARSARHAAQAQLLLAELAQDDLKRTGCPPAIAALQTLSRSRQANLLRHWLAVQHGARPSAVQLDELLEQVADCTTRGHRIALKVAGGQVCRQGAGLVYLPQ